MNLPTTAKYTVKMGDTLYKIAKEYNITIPELIKSNPNVNPYALFVGQIILIPNNKVTNKNYKQYENIEYNIRFKYPFSWKKVEPTRYEGDSGFFNISAISSISRLEDLCKCEACHSLLPYGTKPNIKIFHHIGRKACIIMPSQDQAPEMKNQAAFIVEYPFEVEIQGDRYNYFLLWASKEHIEDLIKTLKFIKLKI